MRQAASSTAKQIRCDRFKAFSFDGSEGGFTHYSRLLEITRSHAGDAADPSASGSGTLAAVAPDAHLYCDLMMA